VLSLAIVHAIITAGIFDLPHSWVVDINQMYPDAVVMPKVVSAKTTGFAPGNSKAASSNTIVDSVVDCNFATYYSCRASIGYFLVRFQDHMCSAEREHCLGYG